MPAFEWMILDNTNPKIWVEIEKPLLPERRNIERM
jgi:hypothetical protein